MKKISLLTAIIAVVFFGCASNKPITGDLLDWRGTTAALATVNLNITLADAATTGQYIEVWVTDTLVNVKKKYMQLPVAAMYKNSSGDFAMQGDCIMSSNKWSNYTGLFYIKPGPLTVQVFYKDAAGANGYAESKKVKAGAGQAYSYTVKLGGAGVEVVAP